MIEDRMDWQEGGSKQYPNVVGALAGLIDAVGAQDFGSRLLDCLNSSCGAEYCTVLHLNADMPTTIATERLQGLKDLASQQLALYFQDNRWRHDPMIALANEKLNAKQLGVVRMPINDMPFDFTDLLWRRTEVCDRIILCSRGEFGIVMVSVLRTVRCGTFSQGELLTLGGIGELIMSAIKKHVEIRLRSEDLMLAFTSLEAIERNLAAAVREISLSRREAEVCARILYGMSTYGIALDLGVGEETVVTYRKRAYQRLGISTQRDLYLWYLGRWNSAGVPRMALN